VLSKKAAGARAGALVHEDLPLPLRLMRDLVGEGVDRVLADHERTCERMQEFAATFMPALGARVERYTGSRPIFDLHGVEEEIQRSLERKVPLKSGGYLIIDQTEALTTIDVNTGAYVGHRNLEETIYRTNLEAAVAIARQLRLRNLGGIIIIDFIDMDKAQNREKVFKSLQEALGRDKAKTNVLKISELGLVEMTRKRVRESTTRMMNEPCSYCDGKGHIKSKITVAYEVFREIRREAPHFPDPVLVVNCHPEVANVLQGEERDELRYLMDRCNKTIQVKSQGSYHQEQFDIYGRHERVDQGREGGLSPTQAGAGTGRGAGGG